MAGGIFVLDYMIPAASVANDSANSLVAAFVFMVETIDTSNFLVQVQEHMLILLLLLFVFFWYHWFVVIAVVLHEALIIHPVNFLFL